jgi:hypothetical protein
MYFIKENRQKVCHILDDEETGSAPAPCGAQADRLDLMNYRNGRPTPKIMKEMPTGMRLCKHCQEAER